MKKKLWTFALSFVLLFTLLVASTHQTSSALEEAAKAGGSTESALNGQSHLSHVVKIYVPSTVNGNIPITEEAHGKFVDKALTTFSNWFGGATAVEGVGAWVDPSKQLIKEKVTIVYSFAEVLNKEAVNQVVAYARQMKKDLGQSSVSVEVDGKLYFIE